MICRNCGAQIPAGARACPRCGRSGARPSREEVLARARGEDRGAPVAARGGVAGPDASAVRSGLGILLLLLSAVLLFVPGGATAPDVWTGETQRYALFGSAPLAGVLMLALCLVACVCAALPLLDMDTGRSRQIGKLLAALALPLGAVCCIAAVRSRTLSDTMFSTGGILVQGSLGLVGILFLVLCALAALTALLPGAPATPRPAHRPTYAPRTSGHSAEATRRPTGAAYAARSSARSDLRQSPRPAAPAEQHPEERPAAPRAEKKPAMPSLRRTPPQDRRDVTPPDAETIAALRRMAQMHDQGLVSDAEFARIKAECVARGWIRE